MNPIKTFQQKFVAKTFCRVRDPSVKKTAFVTLQKIACDQNISSNYAVQCSSTAMVLAVELPSSEKLVYFQVLLIGL